MDPFFKGHGDSRYVEPLCMFISASNWTWNLVSNRNFQIVVRRARPMFFPAIDDKRWQLLMDACMHGWVGGWMDGWMDESVDGLAGPKDGH